MFLTDAPGAIAPHSCGDADLYVLAMAEGGRRTPFFTGYRPQFFFGTTSVTGTLAVAESGALPGQRIIAGFNLDKKIGVEPGMRFAIREGRRTVGAGIITAVR